MRGEGEGEREEGVVEREEGPCDGCEGKEVREKDDVDDVITPSSSFLSLSLSSSPSFFMSKSASLSREGEEAMEGFSASVNINEFTVVRDAISDRRLEGDLEFKLECDTPKRDAGAWNAYDVELPAFWELVFGERGEEKDGFRDTDDEEAEEEEEEGEEEGRGRGEGEGVSVGVCVGVSALSRRWLYMCDVRESMHFVRSRESTLTARASASAGEGYDRDRYS